MTIPLSYTEASTLLEMGMLQISGLTDGLTVVLSQIVLGKEQ